MKTATEEAQHIWAPAAWAMAAEGENFDKKKEKAGEKKIKIKTRSFKQRQIDKMKNLMVNVKMFYNLNI